LDEVQQLFPIRVPTAARATAWLALGAALLLTYRMYYQPPMMALLQSTVRSRLVRAIFAPKRNDQSAAQRPQSPPQPESQATGEQIRPQESSPASDDLLPAARATAAGEDQLGINSEDQQDGAAQGTPAPSLSQALLDALKNMFANQQGQSGANPQTGQKGDDQQAKGGPSQSGQGDDRDQQGGQDSEQKNPQGTASGAGDTQSGTKELQKTTPLAVKAVPDRVPLQAQNLKDQPLVNAGSEAGTAKIATGNATPADSAVINGSEQEDVPARYRSYVQRYFGHPDSGKP
jgi:hypothetical protein